MTDNPAVRAVAESFRVFVCEPTDEGGEMGVFAERHPEAEPRFDWSSREALALEALAALASSQEVRDWLSAELANKARLKPGGEVTRYVGIILHALGGGE